VSKICTGEINNKTASVRRQTTICYIYKEVAILRQRRKIHIIVGSDQEWMVAGVVMVENRGMWCDAKKRMQSKNFFLLDSVNSNVCVENNSDPNAL
jgi:hypothetical protein